MADDIRDRIRAAERRLMQERQAANRDAARALRVLIEEAFPALPPGEMKGGGS